MYLGTPAEGRAMLASLSSSSFYWFIKLLSDCRYLNRREEEVFPLATKLLRHEFAEDVERAMSSSSLMQVLLAARLLALASPAGRPGKVDAGGATANGAVLGNP